MCSTINQSIVHLKIFVCLANTLTQKQIIQLTERRIQTSYKEGDSYKIVNKQLHKKLEQY